MHRIPTLCFICWQLVLCEKYCRRLCYGEASEWASERSISMERYKRTLEACKKSDIFQCTKHVLLLSYATENYPLRQKKSKKKKTKYMKINKKRFSHWEICRLSKMWSQYWFAITIYKWRDFLSVCVCVAFHIVGQLTAVNISWMCRLISFLVLSASFFELFVRALFDRILCVALFLMNWP